MNQHTKDRDVDAVLTWNEIESLYPSEWVLIADPTLDRRDEVRFRGRVLFHSSDRDEVERKVIALRPQRFAVDYVGPILEERMDYLL